MLLQISRQILALSAFLKIKQGDDRVIGITVEKREFIALWSELWLYSYTSN